MLWSFLITTCLLGLGQCTFGSVSLHTSLGVPSSSLGSYWYLPTLVGQHGRAQTASLVTFQASRALLRTSWTSPACCLWWIFFIGVIFCSLGFCKLAGNCSFHLCSDRRTLLVFSMVLAMQARVRYPWSGFAGMFTDAGGILHVIAMCAHLLHSIIADAPCFAAMEVLFVDK